MNHDARTRKKLISAAIGGLTTSIAVLGVLGIGSPAMASPDNSGPSASSKRPAEAASQRKAKWRFDATAASMTDINKIIGADQLQRVGVNGSGVGVALVDTGIVGVAGLKSKRIVNGPDLSIESQVPGLQYQDTYGHGTHLGGIIAGVPANDGSGFTGVAPGSTLVSVKVGAAAGIVDVSQVIAGIDWVVEHRNDNPNSPIRVLNLSYGTDGTQDYRIDPLSHAVENAWRAGIVVVVAAGNAGVEAPRLMNPAYDPYVIAVGAADSAGTVRTNDDVVSDFSSRGDAARRVDLVAPGRSIVSLRDPGGFVDATYPEARVGESYTKGSGTSQAAAVVSGAVALLLQQRPNLNPDQIKRLLVNTATDLPQADAAGAGAGEIDLVRAALTTSVSAKAAAQGWDRSTGLGSLEAARGTSHISINGVELNGEQGLLGAFNAKTWAAASSNGTAWVGGTWVGQAWTGDGWTGLSWSGLSWSGLSWSGLSWSGLSWSGLSWSGLSWSGLSWSGLSWSGLSWSGLSWSGLSWSGLSWSGLSWSAGVWD